MSRFYWLHVAAIGGCLAASVADAQGVGDNTTTQPRAQEREQAPSQDIQKPDPLGAIQERIAGTLKAIHDAAEAQDEKDRQKRDLEAQENMAFWALWMFGATALQVLLSGAGVILILKTLSLNRDATKAAIDTAKEAREANRVTREVFVAGERPWTFVPRVEIDHPLELGGKGFRLWCSIIAKNAGRAPAIDVRVSSILHFPLIGPDMQEAQARLVEEDKKSREMHKGKNFGHIIGPGDEFKTSVSMGVGPGDLEKATAWPIGYINAFVVGCLSYINPLDQTVHRSGFVYHLRRSVEMNPCPPDRYNLEIYPDEQNIPVNELKMKAFGVGFFAD